MKRAQQRRAQQRFVVAGITAALMASTVSSGPAAASPTPPNGASDSFSRSVAGGWGSAEAGGVYRLDERDKFAAADGSGSIVVERGTDRNADLAVSMTDVSARVRFQLNTIASTGNGLYFAVKLRSDAAGNEYRARVRVTPGGVGYVSVLRVVGATQAAEFVSNEVRIPGTMTPGTWYQLAVEVTGSTAVAVRAKVWSGGTEPGWQSVGTDTTPARLTSGTTGLWLYASRSGGDSVVRVDDFAVAPLNVPPPPPPPPANAAPVARFAYGTPALTTSFDASASSDPDGGALTYSWSFSDGGTATGSRVSRTFAAPGSYSATVTVSDPAGASNSTTRTFTVAAVGARLPVRYDLASVPGALFVSTSGSDANAGTLNAPLATVSAALSRIPVGGTGTIVVRGGTYRQGQLTFWNKAVRLVAYPGEIPVFNGAAVMSGTWTNEGSLTWHPYTPQPVTDGSGIMFTRGENLAGDGIGKFPDQAWVGDRQLRQVSSKAAVVAGTFYVDPAGRLYVTAADRASGTVEASRLDRFAQIFGNGVTLEGLTATRFSPSADDYGVVLINGGASNTTLRDVVLSDGSLQAVSLAGTASLAALVRETTFENVSFVNMNWMGVGSSYADGFTLRRVRIEGLNSFGEFTSAPQSGALKATKSRRVEVADSVIASNNSHGLWFDQSNVGVALTGNTITNNAASGVFWELSDDLLLADNLIVATGSAHGVKIAGASGVKMVNNTVIGGADPVGVYADSRSIAGCADPSKPLCTSYASDRDWVRPWPSTLDWMPRIDVMVGNVIANPTGTKHCGRPVPLCFMTRNATAVVTLSSIIHGADPARGIPATVLDGNVYVTSGSGPLVMTDTTPYVSLPEFSAAMARTPVSLPGVEVRGRSGSGLVAADGSLTPALAALHDTAVPAIVSTERLTLATRRFGALR